VVIEPENFKDWAPMTPMISEIPKKLHFIWGLFGDSLAMPDAYGSLYEKWSSTHQNWDVRLHGRDSIQNIVGSYPQFPYDSYSKDIQRCDACRPMLLHKLGGVYSDLDIDPHRNLDELLSFFPGAKVVLATEIVLPRDVCEQIGNNEPIRRGVPEREIRIANYFMASAPHHPFWLEVLELMKQRHKLPIRSQYDVLYTTGPDVITEIAHETAARYSDVAIIPMQIANQFFTHLGTGSWRPSI